MAITSTADVREAEIIKLLAPLFARYAGERKKGERFGDFVVRIGVVAATPGGRSFHDDVKLASGA